MDDGFAASISLWLIFFIKKKNISPLHFFLGGDTNFIIFFLFTWKSRKCYVSFFEFFYSFSLAPFFEKSIIWN